MKKIYSLAAFAFIGIAAHAQAFWTEDFGAGCNRGRVASAYTGTNGAWSIASTGSNGNTANEWFVSSASAGTGAGNCASSCVTANTQNGTLHVSNVLIVIPSFYTANPDTGASYFSGGLSSFGYTGNTSKRAESPTINCTGRTNITVDFIYVENGDGANDDAQFVYSADGGSTWSVLNTLAKTPVATCGTDGQWTAIAITLPASANNNAMVKIGFTWVNNDDGVGTDPSFSVDDVVLTNNPLGVPAFAFSNVNVFSSGNGEIKINSGGYTYKTLGVYNLLGEETNFTSSANSILLNEAHPGIYIVALEINGVRVTRKVMMN